MSLFTFEATVPTDQSETFEILMRHTNGQIVWSKEFRLDFSGQYGTDDPYEPSNPRTVNDLTWALWRQGWDVQGEWDESMRRHAAADVRPRHGVAPAIELSADILAAL